MNPSSRFRIISGLSLIVALAALVMPVAIGAPDPPPSCTETGPHSTTSCLQAGSYISPVRLTWTNTTVLQGSVIASPGLIGPVFNPGKKLTYIFYDCAENAYANHYVTNDVIYLTNIVFTPSFPTYATSLGTNSYSMSVTGVASGGVCSPLGPLSFNIKVVVWGNGDSDYDGISDYQEALNGTNPNDSSSASPIRLGYWPFDNTNTWVGSAGQLPLTTTNIVGVPSWNTNGGFMATNGLAILKYRDVETNGNANINLRNGSVRLWFKPNWSSTDVGGTGLQNEGRLVEMGTKGSTNGWWALTLDASGTNLCFGTQTNASATLRTNLLAVVSWTSNIWHQVVLSYGATNSSLYFDGQPVNTIGIGVTNYPGLTARALGFTIGSSASGTNQAKGTFDELESFNYPLDAASVQANYQAAIALDSDGDGLSNILENQLGTNPYGINSTYGLSSTNGLQVFTPLK